MDTTNRIDSEYELEKFFHKLIIANIDIPSNVTLEIESPTLENEIKNNFFNAHGIDTSGVERVEIQRVTYMGKKITFKS